MRDSKSREEPFTDYRDTDGVLEIKTKEEFNEIPLDVFRNQIQG
jgi:hypothetical protein